MSRRVSVFLCVLVGTLLPALLRAQTPQFEFYPGASYDPAVPTLEQVVGHRWGENITLHAEAERYLKALAEASPKVELVRYGESWEGRALYYVVVSSEANLARVAEVKAGMQKLADPRKTPPAEANRLIATLPAVTWLAYGVHGNEISSPDAALLLAYHLAASRNDAVVAEILEKTVVVIDPMQNPDGRDRFIHYFRQTRGRWPDADPQAAEHNETWPAGRTNHYLFDLNRDWFAGTQPETRARVAIYQEWFPVTFVDLHEMGSNSTYYFAPPAPPLNPNLPAFQREWWRVFGQNNARWFDRFRFDYFTREVYDSFYPGYGEGWPLFQGSIGMTYEQASVRGLVVDREDKTTLHFRDSVRQHFIASLATAQTAAQNREKLLRYFYDFRRTAIEEGQQETVKEYLLPPGRDAKRVAKLVGVLMRQGIEVKRAETPFTNPRVRDYVEGQLQSKQFPAGTFVISLAQPTKRLIKTLLERHTPMEESFIQEQIRRRNLRQGDEIYDVTAWSLCLLYDVDCYAAEQASAGQFTTLTQAPERQGQVHGGRAQLAYLVPWDSNSAAEGLAALLRHRIRVYMTDQPIVLNSRRYPIGSLVIKVRDNPEDLYEQLQHIAAHHGVDFYATDSGWIEEGVNLGSRHVRYVEPPRVALVWNLPTSPNSAGWTRYLLEQVYHVPVTLIHGLQLAGADLSRYNVLILPDGGFGPGYDAILGERGASRIKEWVQQGGTLIAFGAATRWLTGEKVGLLASQRELRSGKLERATRAESNQPGGAKGPEGGGAFDYEKHILPEREPPFPTPGAILRVKLDPEHWLAAGYDDDTYALVESDLIFTPLKLDQGRNVGIYFPSEQVLASGFIYESSRQQIGQKAFLMHQPMGRGHVIAFAEDPNYRAFQDGLNLLFLNGVFFGPAH